MESVDRSINQPDVSINQSQDKVTSKKTPKSKAKTQLKKPTDKNVPNVSLREKIYKSASTTTAIEPSYFFNNIVLTKQNQTERLNPPQNNSSEINSEQQRVQIDNANNSLPRVNVIQLLPPSTIDKSDAEQSLLTLKKNNNQTQISDQFLIPAPSCAIQENDLINFQSYLDPNNCPPQDTSKNINDCNELNLELGDYNTDILFINESLKFNSSTEKSNNIESCEPVQNMTDSAQNDIFIPIPNYPIISDFISNNPKITLWDKNDRESDVFYSLPLSLLDDLKSILRNVPVVKKKIKDSSTDKVNRSSLTLLEKVGIVKLIENGFKQNDAGKLYGRTKQTISSVWVDRDKIIYNSQNNKDSASISRIRGPTNKELEDCMKLWFERCCDEGICISGLFVKEAALHFMKLIEEQTNSGPKKFTASNGWLQKWCKRQNIPKMMTYGDRLFADVEAAEGFVETFNLLKNEYDIDFIFNADETVLFWKAFPDAKLPSGVEISASERTIPKNRVSIMTCANASGKHRLPLFVLGESAVPQRFSNSNEDQSIPFNYKQSTNGCMTSDIFLDWYVSKFIQNVLHYQHLIQKKGNVMLIVDSAASHPRLNSFDISGVNFKIFFFPPRVTSLIQPMNQGIIHAFKNNYRSLLMHSLLAAKDSSQILDKLINFNLPDALYFMSSSWEKITSEALFNCWNPLFNRKKVETTINQQSNQEIDIILSTLNKVPGFEEVKNHHILHWFSMNDTVNTIEESEILDIFDLAFAKDKQAPKKRSRPAISSVINSLDILLQELEALNEENSIFYQLAKKYRQQYP